MRILLDTQVLLWALAKPARLPERFREQIEDKSNEVLFSAASIWEVAVKSALGRMAFDVDPRAVVEAAGKGGFAELPVRCSAAAMVAALPRTEPKDPFDRLLLAQAISEPAVLHTIDPRLPPYSPDLVKLI